MLYICIYYFICIISHKFLIICDLCGIDLFYMIYYQINHLRSDYIFLFIPELIYNAKLFIMRTLIPDSIYFMYAAPRNFLEMSVSCFCLEHLGTLYVTKVFSYVSLIFIFFPVSALVCRI